MVSYDDVAAAAARLDGLVITTPVITSGAVDALAGGASVFLKVECCQVTGSFKYRGASNAIAQLTGAERRAGVVTYSSGNHAQAVARAARDAGTTAVVVMPHDAPELKVAGTEAAGARIVRYDRYTEDRVALAVAIARDEARTLIPPYDHPAVIAGQGTAAVELLQQVPDLHALVVPVGGGGLMAGCALATRHLSPGTELFGVEPAAGDDHVRSRQAGHRVEIGVPRTIADGQQVTSPGELTWPINQRLVTGFLTVTDDQIRAAMALAFSEADLLLEPSGASGLAAVLAGSVSGGASDGVPGGPGRRIGVILSGGNVSESRFHQLLSGAD